MKPTLQKIGKLIDDQIGVLLLLPLFSHTFSPVLSPNFVLLDILLLLFARLVGGNLRETIKAKSWMWRESFILLLAAFMALVVIYLFFSEKLARDFQLGFWNFIVPACLCLGVFLLTGQDTKLIIEKSSRTISWIFILISVSLVFRLGFNVPIDYPIMRQVTEFDPSYDSQYNRGIISLTLMFFPVWQIVWNRLDLSAWERSITIVAMVAAMSAVLILGANHSARFAFAFSVVAFILTFVFPNFILKQILFLTTLVILIQPFFGNIVYFIFQNGHFKYFKETFEFRTYIWIVFGERIWDNAIFGHGIGSSELLNFGEYIKKNFREDFVGKSHPHNNFLQVWFEFGLVGVLLIMISLGTFLQEINRNQPNTKPYMVGFFIVTFIIALVSHGLWQAWWITAIGVAYLMYKLKN